MSHKLRILFLICVTCLTVPTIARADEPSEKTIEALQAQINSLQKQLNDLKAAKTSKNTTTEETQAAAVVPVAQVPASLPTANGGDNTEVASSSAIQPAPAVKVTAGGFIAAEALERSKNQTTDIGSSFNNLIPFKNSVNAHQSEFRGTARQSRLTLLAEGTVDANTKLSAYVESDFLGAAPTANSVESNSYNPRLRVAYATIDQNDWGFHVLAGQEWSLLTMNKVGITPRQEDIPLTIDAQYVPGFNWTRNPQVRLVKDFDDQQVWAGVSLESPQVNFGGSTSVTDSNGIAVPPGVNATSTGNSPLSTASYSSDFAPDIIGKLALDPGWGHFETFGILRFFHDNVSTGFHNNSAVGRGVGAGAILPVIPKKLDLQANVMIGNGIGRYGSALLPDFAFAPGGGIDPLHETTWLIGAIAHPDPTWDIYLYGGQERVGRDNQTSTSLGYGDFALNNSGCLVDGGTCPAQTSSVWQVTPGLWKQLYKGSFGTMKIGLQDSVTRRDTFSDSHGIAPDAYENIVMTSFRYYPF